MGHLMFYLAAVAACLLWTATFIAAAARTERPWLRRLLAAIGVVVPPLAVLPWVWLTGMLAFGAGLETNWLAPTLTAFLAAVIGGAWIRRAGLSRTDLATGFVAAAWPVIGLAAMFVMAKAVAFGTLLFIDNAVAAEGRALRVEAAQLMAASMPPSAAADDDATPLYLRAFAMIEADPTLRDEASPATKPATTDIAAPQVAALLARHAASLDLLRRAADRPGCRFVRDWSRPSIAMLLPEIQQMRTAARLLSLAARREAADGEAAAAIRDIVRIHRIGMHAATEPILVCGLVGQAVDSVALDTLAAVLPTLAKKDLSLLDDLAFRDFLATPLSFQRHFLGEEAFGLSTIADLADGRGGTSALALLDAGNGAGPREFLLSEPLSLLFRCFLLPADLDSYRTFMRRYQQLAASVSTSKPYAEIRKQTEELEKPLKQRTAGIFTSLMAPALSNVLWSQRRALAGHEAAEMLVAATRVRLATGTLPESADALVPDTLPALPRDPFTADQPLLSKRTDGSWLVYSVGPDGEDDGGPPSPGADRPNGNDDVGLALTVAPASLR